jgi:L-ascorbate metabolism protein UlaG (beta-lactamase superfamily)
MKIKWWGHACFLITNGTEILTDPYDDSLPYDEIDDRPDIVTISHEHFDHNAVDRLHNQPQVVNSKEGYTDDNIKIKGIPTYHDKSEGSDKGNNLIFQMEMNGKTVCHIGDLGHLLDAEKLNELKDTDILLIPVGGNYTINATEAFQIAEKIDPSVIIPMHYKTDILDFPITGVKDFVEKYDEGVVREVSTDEIEIDQMPDSKKVYVLDYVRK